MSAIMSGMVVRTIVAAAKAAASRKRVATAAVMLTRGAGLAVALGPRGGGGEDGRGVGPLPHAPEGAVAVWGAGNNWPVPTIVENKVAFVPRGDGCDDARRELIERFNAENGWYWHEPCDFNRDGVVDSQDFFDFLAAFNASGSR